MFNNQALTVKTTDISTKIIIPISNNNTLLGIVGIELEC